MRSLTSRIVAGFGAMGLALGLALAAVTYYASDRHDRANVVEMLETELAQLRHSPGPVSLSAGHAAIYQAPVDEPDVIPPEWRRLPPGLHWLPERDPPVAALVERQEGMHRVVLHDLSSEQARDAALRGTLLFGVLLAVVLALAGGAWLARRILAPVRRLAGTVRDLQGQPATAALDDGFADDEIGELARALDGYSRQLGELLERERWFASHASHELRTPLTVLRGAIEAGLADPQLREPDRKRLQRMERATQEMQSLIEMFLLLARTDLPAEAPCSSVAAVVREVAASQRLWLRSEGVEVQILEQADRRLSSPPQVLQVVVANLVRNAYQHTVQGSVRILISQNAVSVTDSGSGLAAAARERLFEPGYSAKDRSTGAAGLGLHIVQRLCARYGWRVELETLPHGGTRATLRFDGPSPHAAFTSS